MSSHQPLSKELTELNGVQALLRLLESRALAAGDEAQQRQQEKFQARIADAATRALGQLCAMDASIVAMVAAAGKGDLPAPQNERPLDLDVSVEIVSPESEPEPEPDRAESPVLPELPQERSPEMPPSDESGGATNPFFRKAKVG
eukprot:COSAG06_NODE_148_length_22056_cov_75.881239_4_plen_145_part_00